MSDPGHRGPARGAFRRNAARAALVLAGGCIGVVLGALLDAPRLLLASWLGPVSTVELDPEPGPRAELTLGEFEAIQRELPPVSAAVGAANGAAASDEPARARHSGAVVQVRAERERADAERLVRRLRQQGFDAFISGTRAGSGEHLRVRVVPAPDETVSELAERLDALGYDTWSTFE